MPSDTESTSSKKQNVNDHLANERTLLAWVRSAIGIMAFGFVVAKSSLFIKQLTLILGKPGSANNSLLSQFGYSAPVGTLLVFAGAVSLLFGLLRYRQTKRQIENHDFQTSSPLLYILVVAILVLSAGLVAYLIIGT